MPTIDESQAYLTHPDGTKIQVLLPDGSAWDEAATAAAYLAYAASLLD